MAILTRYVLHFKVMMRVFKRSSKANKEMLLIVKYQNINVGIISLKYDGVLFQVSI